jgi:hypothetical protein
VNQRLKIEDARQQKQLEFEQAKSGMLFSSCQSQTGY